MENEIWELVGILIGDGNLWMDERHYRIELTLNPITDQDYLLNYIVPMFRKLTQNKIVIKERQRALRMRICDKALFYRFLELGLYPRKEKLKKLDFLNNLNIEQRKLVIRGLVDTDGHVGKGYYINISTSSRFLAKWVSSTLKELNFNPMIRIRKYQNINFRDLYIIDIRGRIYVEKWMLEIGFSNKYKFYKALSALSK